MAAPAFAGRQATTDSGVQMFKNASNAHAQNLILNREAIKADFQLNFQKPPTKTNHYTTYHQVQLHIYLNLLYLLLLIHAHQ